MRSYLEKHSLAARFWILSVYSYFLLLFYFLCRFNWCSLLTGIPKSAMLESIHQNGIHTIAIECFHMTSRRPYWCPKTIKRRPCWCPKPILSELNSFLMQTLSFVPINLHRCWPSTNLKKFRSSKLDKFTLFTHFFVGWNLENRYKESVSIFFRLSWHFKPEKSVFWKASFGKTRTDYAFKTSWTRLCDW